MKLLVADYNRLAARMLSKARLDAKLAKLQYSSFQEHCQQPFGIHQGKSYNDLMMKIRGSQYILIVKICD